MIKPDCNNNIISQSQFAQIPKGFSKIFKIIPKPKEDIILQNTKIKLYDDITYQGKYLNATDLRTFLYLSYVLSTSRKETQLFKSIDEIDIEKYPSNKYITRVPTLKWIPYSGIREMLKFFDLKVRPENADTISKSLDRLTNSYLQTNTFKSRLISYTYNSLIFNPTFTSLFNKRFKNHNLTPKLYPLTTVKMNVVKHLSKLNINKLIIYYYLCDNVDFKQKTILFIHQLSSLWLKTEDNKKTKSFRRKFIKETLKEIEELSQDFEIKINSTSITIARIPDIKNKTTNKLHAYQQYTKSKTKVENKTLNSISQIPPVGTRDA